MAKNNSNNDFTFNSAPQLSLRSCIKKKKKHKSSGIHGLHFSETNEQILGKIKTADIPHRQILLMLQSQVKVAFTKEKYVLL